MKKQRTARMAPGIAGSAALVVVLLSGCASGAGPEEAAAPADTASESPLTPSATPTATPTPPADASADAPAEVVIGPDDVRLVLGGSTSTFGYRDEPAELVAALTAAFGEEPAIEADAGDPDCGASTSYSYSPGLRIRQLDPMPGAQVAEEGRLGFKVFADASAASLDSAIRITTTAGGELGEDADALFDAVPASWIDEGAGARAAVLESSTLLGPAEDVDAEGAWRDRWGLAVAEDQGALTRIGSPVGLAYFC